jgi:hypothetical protein
MSFPRPLGELDRVRKRSKRKSLLETASNSPRLKDHPRIGSINNLAGAIDSNRAVRGKMKVVVLPNYRVTLAERLIRARDCLQPDLHRLTRICDVR